MIVYIVRRSDQRDWEFGGGPDPKSYLVVMVTRDEGSKDVEEEWVYEEPFSDHETPSHARDAALAKAASMNATTAHFEAASRRRA